MALGVPDRVRCARALETLFERCDGVHVAMLALRDGRPFVEKTRRTMDSGRMAAMTSSLVALGQSVLKELNAGALDHILIEGGEGKLVVSTVPGTGGLLLLAVWPLPAMRASAWCSVSRRSVAPKWPQPFRK